MGLLFGSSNQFEEPLSKLFLLAFSCIILLEVTYQFFLLETYK